MYRKGLTQLSESGRVVRLTGPSGLGKTRLAFEVLNAGAKDTPDPAEMIRRSLESSAIYLDMQVSGNRVLEWVTQLNQWGLQGVVIVDNCSRDDHNLLERAVMNLHSRLSLLTLDYVPEHPIGTETMHLSLTPEIMMDIVPKILRSNPELVERLTQAGIDRISRFAHGFPRIAVLTAEAGQALSLTELNQVGGIANKLLWGHEFDDPQAKEYLRCVAAFTEVGREGKFKGQLDFVLMELCGGISEYQFNKSVKRFRNNRVLQDVGDFVMVSPPPLAVALAADWLEDLTESDIHRLLPGMEGCGLVDAFARRLEQLDFSEKAQELSAKLMGHGGPFASAEVLNSEAGSRVFRSLSDLNPPAALECLSRIYGRYSPDEARALTGGRRDLVWTAEKLCWKAEHFSRAARILLIFAAGENESWTNNATGQFCQLFHLFLSGTQCPALDRLSVLADGLKSPHAEVRRVCVHALGHGLQSDRFTRSSSSTDPRAAELDWRPNVHQECWEYWRSVFRLLADVILHSPDPGLVELAGDELGENLGGILTTPLASDLLDEFRALASRMGNCWPTARDAIKRTLRYDAAARRQFGEALRSWLECVDPKDLRSMLLDKVVKSGWDQEEQPDGTYKNLAEEGAVEVARQVHEAGTRWLAEIDVFFVGEQHQTFVFGKTLADASDDPSALFHRCLEAFRQHQGSERNPQLLKGMILALAERGMATPIIELVAADSTLRDELLIPLTGCALPQISDFKRVTDLVIRGEMPPRSLDWFALGGVTCEFEPGEFVRVLTEVLDAVPDSAPWILHIAYMSVFQNSDRFTVFRDLFARLVASRAVVDGFEMSSVAHAWQRVLKPLLNGPLDPDLVSGLAQLIIEDAKKQVYFGLRDSPVASLPSELLTRYPEVAWPIFERNLRDEEGKPSFSLVDLLCRTGILDASGTRLWDKDESAFRCWAGHNPDLISIAAERMPLYVVAKRDSPVADLKVGGEDGSVDFNESVGNEYPVRNLRPDECHVWHSLASCVLDLIGHRDMVFTLMNSLLSFGSTGSRVPYLEARMRLVRDLEATPDADLHAVASEVVSIVQSEILREQKIDAQRAAGIHAW